jgi:hypothetical protein
MSAAQLHLTCTRKPCLVTTLPRSEQPDSCVHVQSRLHGRSEAAPPCGATATAGLRTQACAICVLGPHAAWLQETQEQVNALEGSMVEAHKRVMRACADMAIAQQQAQVERLHAQALQVELKENTETWQREVVLRLEMEEECRRQATRMEQAVQNERAAVQAAEEGLQAHEGLVKQARLQQKRLGMLAHLKVRPRASRPLPIVVLT